MAYFRCGSGGMPAGLQSGMDAVLNKKFGTSTTYPPSGWPSDVNLLGPLPVKTASGAIASFSDGADDVPVKSCKVTFTPSGGGGTPSSPVPITGYTGLTLTRTGKNLLDDTLANLEQGSINGSTGANENANNRVRNVSAIPFPYDKIASNYTWTIPSGYKVAIRPYDKDGNFVQLPSWALAFITQLPQDLIGQGITQMRFVLAKNDNSAITPSDMANIGFQLEVGSTATTYSAYVTPSVTQDTFGQTIYGGERDLTTDKVNVTYGKVVFDGTEGTGGTASWTMISVTQGTMFRITVSNKATTSATNTACSHYIPTSQEQRADGTVSGAGTNVDIIDNRFSSVDAFKQWLSENPVTLVYQLATPTEITGLTSHEISTMLGDNNFYADVGNTAVEYRADIQLALNP